MRERELKLSIPDRFELPTLQLDGRPLTVEALPDQQLRATYHDTDDLRLARHGVTLRHRTGESAGAQWTVKLPSVPGADGAADREELHFAGRAGAVPSRARDMVTAYARTVPMRPVATLRTRRRRWVVSDNGTELAELADDQVSVLEGRRVVARFRELEIEARAADTDLPALAAQLTEAGAVTAEPIPKVVRALGSRATSAPDLAPPVLSEDATGTDLVAASIGDAALRMIRNDPLARLGDEEGIHQLRVATRRLRTDLRAFAPLISPEWRDEIEPRLRELADSLGAVRDLDVLETRLTAEAGDLHAELRPLWKAFTARRARALKLLTTAMGTVSYADLLERLVEAALRPPVTPDASVPAISVAGDVSAAAWRRLVRSAKDLGPDAPDEAFHATRIRAKRARYAAEAAARALPAKRAAEARRFADRLADLQDLLGGLQDSVVAVAELREAVDRRATNAPFALAAGRLIEREARGAADARAGFGSLWADLRRARRRRWIEV